MEEDTQVGAAANETTVEPVVEYPSTPLAWTAAAEPWYEPTESVGRRLLGYLKSAPVVYLVAVVAIIIGAAAWGTRPNRPTAPPMPAPPVAVVPSWTPSKDNDDKYIQAMKDAGWTITNRQDDLANAHWSCTYLSQGHSKADVISYWDQQPWQGETAAQNHDDDQQWIGLVVDILCPQYR